MKTKQELNFMQRLLLKKDHIPTDLMRDFYKKMKNAPQVPEKLKKGIGPERAVSDYIDALTFGKNLAENKQGYVLVHEYEEDGKKCKLTLEQGFLSDWEICYPATYFEIEKNGDVVVASTIGANLLRGTELVPIMEYARIMYGEEVYAHMMELAAKKLETVPFIPCDASYDGVQERYKNSVTRFLKFDRTSREIINEYKRMIKQKEKYDYTRKEADIINDTKKQKFDEDNQVLYAPTKVIKMPDKKREDRERVDD